MSAPGAEVELPESRNWKLIEHRGAYVWDNTETEAMPGFRCREDDVWICSFPRTGTTLTQQTVYLIMTLDFEKATTVDLDDRFPIAENYEPDGHQPYYRGLKYLDNWPRDRPRLIKSHLHHYLLPDELRNGKGRIIYITRNPKASIVSLYKVLKYIKNPPAPTLQDYVERFLTQKDVLACPWGLHVREYWERRNDPNVLFIQFEKFVKDRRGTIKSMAAFLGKDLTDEQVDKIAEATSLDSMKNNSSCNLLYRENICQTDKTEGAFINKGEVSGWKNELSADHIRRMDELIQRELKDTDISYE